MLALIVLLVFVSLLLIVLIYLQSGKVKNLGSSLVGIKSVELFENTKKRGLERVIFWSTIFLVFLFFAFSISLFVFF